MLVCRLIYEEHQSDKKQPKPRLEPTTAIAVVINLPSMDLDTVLSCVGQRWVMKNRGLIMKFSLNSRFLKDCAEDKWDAMGWMIPTVINSINTWRKDGGASLVTWVTVHVIRMAKNAYRNTGWWPGFCKHGRYPILFGDTEPVVIDDGPIDDGMDEELKNDVSHAFHDVLTERERQALTIYLGLDGGPYVSRRKVAAQMLISHERAGQLIASGLTKIGKEIGVQASVRKFPKSIVSKH